jgi:hypothetical protein
VHFEGDDGKPYKPCKSMRRVMIAAWGVDAAQYIGRSMTLYRDAEVMYGGIKVGGIRVSAMSHIDKPIAMALTVTKAKRAPYRVNVLQEAKAPAPVAAPVVAAAPEPAAADAPPVQPLTGPMGVVYTSDAAGVKQWWASWQTDLHAGHATIEEFAESAEHAREIFQDNKTVADWIVTLPAKAAAMMQPAPDPVDA